MPRPKKSIQGGEVSPLAPDSSPSPATPAPVSSATPLERLPEGWNRTTIEAVAEKTVIGPFGSRMKSDTYTQSGVPVIRGTNLTDGKSLSGDWVYVSESFADELKNCNAIPGDIVFPHRGAIGEVGIVPSSRERYMLSTSLMLMRCNLDLAIPDYIYYFFNTNIGKHELLKNASQVGTPGIGQPLSSLRSIELILPPIAQQQKIAAILSSLDDKIAINRATIATLEEIARALFKSWFIDFDPVRAKARGEKPFGMDDATAALFPDSFEESELGMIPKGWEVKSLDEVAHYLNGLALQKFPATPNKPSLPVIKIAELKQGSSKGADRASTDVPSEYTIDDGDVIFSWSGSLYVDIWCGGPGALNQHLFKVTSDTYPKWLYFQWTKHHLADFQKIAADKAVTMGHIKREHLTNAKCFVPKVEDIPGYSSAFCSILDKQIKLRLEINNLELIRDALLPKLLSGEISVADAAEMAEGL